MWLYPLYNVNKVDTLFLFYTYEYSFQEILGIIFNSYPFQLWNIWSLNI